MHIYRMRNGMIYGGLWFIRENGRFRQNQSGFLLICCRVFIGRRKYCRAVGVWCVRATNFFLLLWFFYFFFLFLTRKLFIMLTAWWLYGPQEALFNAVTQTLVLTAETFILRQISSKIYHVRLWIICLRPYEKKFNFTDKKKNSYC